MSDLKANFKRGLVLREKRKIEREREGGWEAQNKSLRME